MYYTAFRIIGFPNARLTRMDSTTGSLRTVLQRSKGYEMKNKNSHALDKRRRTVFSDRAERTG
jgi:hypothetical protein